MMIAHFANDVHKLLSIIILRKEQTGENKFSCLNI